MECTATTIPKAHSDIVLYTPNIKQSSRVILLFSLICISINLTVI